MFVLAFALACSSAPTGSPSPAPSPPVAAPEPPPPEPAAPLPDSPEARALARAAEAGKAFGGALKERLKSALDAGGAPQAVAVCQSDAPQLAATIMAERGVKLGRSSLRLRNPANQGPDWVQAWLLEQGERSAAGVLPLKTIAQVEGAPVARLAVPIPVEPLCLGCHGPVDTLAPELLAALGERYPQDRAVGYALDDLRGALWVESPVTP